MCVCWRVNGIQSALERLTIRIGEMVQKEEVPAAKLDDRIEREKNH